MASSVAHDDDSDESAKRLPVPAAPAGAGAGTDPAAAAPPAGGDAKRTPTSEAELFARAVKEQLGCRICEHHFTEADGALPPMALRCGDAICRP